jgi:inorganic pyrophosphatase
MREIQRFFLDYKILENKAVDVEQIRGRSAALPVIHAAVRLYRERIASAPVRPGIESP